MDYLHAQQAAEKAEATESAEQQEEPDEEDEEEDDEEEETVVDVEEFVPPIVFVSPAKLMQRGRPSRNSKLSFFYVIYLFRH